MRRPTRKAVGLLALVWAIGAPLFLLRHDLRDENEDRRLMALAVDRLGASAEDYATNARVSIPRVSVEMVRDLAQAQERRASTFARVVYVSSAFILVLTILVFKNSEDEKKDA